MDMHMHINYEIQHRTWQACGTDGARWTVRHGRTASRQPSGDRRPHAQAAAAEAQTRPDLGGRGGRPDGMGRGARRCAAPARGIKDDDGAQASRQQPDPARTPTEREPDVSSRIPTNTAGDCTYRRQAAAGAGGRGRGACGCAAAARGIQDGTGREPAAGSRNPSPDPPTPRLHTQAAAGAAGRGRGRASARHPGRHGPRACSRIPEPEPGSADAGRSRRGRRPPDGAVPIGRSLMARNPGWLLQQNPAARRLL
eukprot:scaffold80_cov106-Isochrysis_galbana.AAC.1